MVVVSACITYGVPVKLDRYIKCSLHFEKSVRDSKFFRNAIQMQLPVFDLVPVKIDRYLKCSLHFEKSAMDSSFF